MSEKLKYEYVKEYIYKLEYILIDNYYINAKIKLTIVDNLNYYYYINFDNLKQGKKPEKFHTYNPYTIQNIKLWCKLNNKPFELVSDIYDGSNKNLKWKCLKENCGEEFENNWRHILGQEQGCPFCTGQKVSLSNCLAIKNPEISKEWHIMKNDSLTPYDVTCGSGKYIWWKCKDCGYEWPAKIYSRNNGIGCPECNKSKGEKEISKILNAKNILFKIQKEFEGLVGLGNGLLSYDFYIPKLNLLIEYHGGQHEKFTRGIHKTMKDFEKQLEHDNRKCIYADKNNIKLLIIWYWDFDNIEEILERELNT